MTALAQGAGGHQSGAANLCLRAAWRYVSTCTLALVRALQQTTAQTWLWCVSVLAPALAG